jgi:hypothetical protein
MYPLEEPTNFSMRRCYDEVRKHNYGMYFLSVLCTAHSSSLSVAGCRLSGSANWQSLCGSKFEVLRVSPTADGASTCLLGHKAETNRFNRYRSSNLLYPTQPTQNPARRTPHKTEMGLFPNDGTTARHARWVLTKTGSFPCVSIIARPSSAGIQRTSQRSHRS